MNPIYNFGVQFLLHWLDYLYSAPQFLLQSNTWIQSSFHCKVHTYWYSYEVLSCNVQYLYSSSLTILTHTHFISTENEIKFKKKHYKIPVLTEYATREKLLLSSSTPSISFSSSPSDLAIFFFLCFPFSLLFCTFVSFPSDTGHKNCSFLESWSSMLASFFNTTAILQMSFLNLSSLRSSNFLDISAFHSVFVYYFNLLAFDLQTISALAFACALFVSKGLQTALALVQGAHEVAWLQIISREKKNSNKYLQQILRNTKYSKVCIPLTQTSSTNTRRSYFSCQLLALLASLWSFLWQVLNTLLFGQRWKVN